MARICVWGTEDFTNRLLAGGQAGGDLLLEPAPTFRQAASRVAEGTCEVLLVQWPARQDPTPLRRLVEAASRPVLVATLAEDSESTIALLQTGVSDVIPATLTPREIVSHLRSLLRRQQAAPVSVPSPILEAGNLRLDRRRHEVTVNGRELPLPPREFDLLAALLARTGQVYPRQELIHRVWGQALPPRSRTLDVHLGRLRARLSEAGAQANILTLPGVGHRLEADS